MALSDSLTLKYRYIHQKCFSSKGMVKNIFLQKWWPTQLVHVRLTSILLKMFHLLKGLYSSYLVLKFGSLLLISSWVMAQNVILQRVYDLERSRSQVKTDGTIVVLGLKNIDLDIKIVILSALSSKVMVKDIFLQNGGQHNAFAYVSHSNCSKCFRLFEGSARSYTVLKFGNNLSSRNQGMTQNVFYRVVTLKGQCHPWRSNIRPPPCVHYTREVSQKSYCQFFHYSRAIIDWKVGRKRKKEYWRNNLTDVDTSWCHFAMREQSDV